MRLSTFSFFLGMTMVAYSMIFYLITGLNASAISMAVGIAAGGAIALIIEKIQGRKIDDKKRLCPKCSKEVK